MDTYWAEFVHALLDSHDWGFYLVCPDLGVSIRWRRTWGRFYHWLPSFHFSWKGRLSRLLSNLFFRLESALIIINSIYLYWNLSHIKSIIRYCLFQWFACWSIAIFSKIFLCLSEIEEVLEFSISLIDLVNRWMSIVFLTISRSLSRIFVI